MTLFAQPNAVFLEAAPSFALDETDSIPSLLACLVDELAHGMLVVSAQGKILHANQAARRELDRAVVLGWERGELKLVMPADAKAFQNALVKAIAGKRGLLKLAADGVEFTLALVPLQRQVGMTPDGWRVADSDMRKELDGGGCGRSSVPASRERGQTH